MGPCRADDISIAAAADLKFAMTELATPTVDSPHEVRRISHWIGGRAVDGGSGRTGPVYNPATGEQTATVECATFEEVDEAGQAAKAAFAAWRTVSMGRRAELMFTACQSRFNTRT